MLLMIEFGIGLGLFRFVSISQPVSYYSSNQSPAAMMPKHLQTLKDWVYYKYKSTLALGRPYIHGFGWA